MTTETSKRIASAIGAALLAAGCARSSRPSRDGAVIVGSEIPASITLTPQTIVIREGHRAVRNISRDGATIALDAGSEDFKNVSTMLRFVLQAQDAGVDALNPQRFSMDEDHWVR